MNERLRDSTVLSLASGTQTREVIAMAGGHKSEGKKSNAGRKSTYDPETYPNRAWAYAARGYTDAQIAEKFGITAWTLCSWKNKYPQFAQSLKKGKEKPDTDVEKALFDSCFDHKVKEIRKVLRKNAKTGEMELVSLEENERIIPANILAQQTWLNNRVSGSWKRNPGANGEIADKDPLFDLLSGIKDKKNDTADNRKTAVSEAD